MDELKSNFVFYLNDFGKKKYVLIHCRGNQLLDKEKIRKILKNNFFRVSQEDLKIQFNLKYGIINPFHFIQNNDVLQIFDKSVNHTYLPPYTMMTNTGHLEQGIEFIPSKLIEMLNNVLIADIIQDHTSSTMKIHTLGILTGNPPESGLLLWKFINSNIREKLGSNFLGDISFPRIIIESLPEMGLSMELEFREKEIKRTVLDGIRRLCENGASLICISCNSTQFFEQEIIGICDEYNATFIPMNKSIDSYLIKNDIKHFDFLGIKYVVDFNKWSAFKSLNEKYNVNIPSQITLKKINEIAFEVKKNNISSRGINKLRDLIHSATKHQHVVIAITEISILLADQKTNKKSDKIYIDTLTILAETIAEIYFKEIKKAFTIPKSK